MGIAEVTLSGTVPGITPLPGSFFTVMLPHWFLLGTRPGLTVCFWELQPETQNIPGGTDGERLQTWEVEGKIGELHGLWLATGDCEFDIKPCQICSFMKHLWGNSQ